MFEITKSQDEHFIVGLVLEPDQVDTQNDIVSVEETARACHAFNKRGWKLFKDHKQPMSEGEAEIVESYITETPVTLGGKAIKPGSWLIKVKISEALYRNAHTIAGFSVAGSSSYREGN